MGVLLSEQGYHRLAWTHLIEWQRTSSLLLYRIPPVLGPRPVSSRVSGTTLTGSGDSAPSLIPVLWTSSIWGPYRRRIEVGSSQVVARSLKESSGLQRFSVGWENQRMQWRSLFNKLFDGRSALCSVFSVRAWKQQEIPGLCCSVRFSFFSRLALKVRMSLSSGRDSAVPITCLFWRVEGEITLPWWLVRSGSGAGLRSFFLRLTLLQAYEFRDFPASGPCHSSPTTSIRSRFRYRTAPRSSVE